MTETPSTWQTLWRWVKAAWTLGTRLQRLEVKLDGISGELAGIRISGTAGE